MPPVPYMSSVYGPFKVSHKIKTPVNYASRFDMEGEGAKYAVIA